MRKLKLAWRRDFKLRPVTSITLYRLTIDISSIHSRPLHVCAFTQLFTHIFYLSNCSPGLVLRSPRRSTSRSSTAAHNRPARRTPLGAPGRTRRKYRVRRRTRTATVGYTWLSDGAELQASWAKACCGVEGARGPGRGRVDAGREGGAVARRQ